MEDSTVFCCLESQMIGARLLQQNNQRRPAQNTNNRCTNAPSRPPNQQQQRSNRPPLRSMSTSNHRSSSNSNTSHPNRNQSTTANIVCNNCGRLGHHSRSCTNSSRHTTSNRGASSRSSPNNENNAPLHQQRAYFITDSGADAHTTFHHQAFVPHPLTQWMTSQTQSHGQTLHSLKWKSTNPYRDYQPSAN